MFTFECMTIGSILIEMNPFLGGKIEREKEKDMK